MTPAARTQSAIELLDQIIAAARDGGPAADTLAARFFAGRRYAGSKDKRAIRELVYAAIRLCGERPESGRASMLALAATDPALPPTFDGSPYGPAVMASDEPVATAAPASSWLVKLLKASGLDAVERAALADRAPLDVRVNVLRATVEEVMPQLPGAVPIPDIEQALRLPAGTRLDGFDGIVEVQDAGSQRVALAVGAQFGDAVVDLCAGAGGKTLAIAAAMGGEGQILACDTDRSRLSRLAPRAEQAGATNVETRLLDPNREAEALGDWMARADHVLVDAPCSGTGTWRRNPEARWRLTPARLATLATLQTRLLDLAATLVKPGGTLIYAVCSLLDAEGADQVAQFLTGHPGWSAVSLDFGTARGAGVRLTPARDATDGFLSRSYGARDSRAARFGDVDAVLFASVRRCADLGRGVERVTRPASRRSDRPALACLAGAGQGGARGGVVRPRDRPSRNRAGGGSA